MKLLSMDTVIRGNWKIRASIVQNEQILICMFNTWTFETVVRAFTDELNANLMIEYILHKNLLKDGYDE
jgi:hypothetical protein